MYTLNEDRQWDDRGTGHVSSTIVERPKGTSLLVRAESDGKLPVSIAALTSRWLALACKPLVRTESISWPLSALGLLNVARLSESAAAFGAIVFISLINL